MSESLGILEEEPEAGTAAAGAFSWGGALHSSYRLIPPSDHLRVFLTNEGKTPDEARAELRHDEARSRARRSLSAALHGFPATANPRRYRDARQVYTTSGFGYEVTEGGRTFIRLTELGRAVARWLDDLVPKNDRDPDEAAVLSARARVLSRYALHALAACQLRNPLSKTARRFPGHVEVFPFAFIWRAMLALDDKISSDELNRAIYSVSNASELSVAITRIRAFRGMTKPDVGILGEETISGHRKNDRVLPWVSLASFGWTVINDKMAGPQRTYYTIDPASRRMLVTAAAVRHPHRTFTSAPEYVEYISAAAGIPPDLR